MIAKKEKRKYRLKLAAYWRLISKLTLDWAKTAMFALERPNECLLNKCFAKLINNDLLLDSLIYRHFRKGNTKSGDTINALFYWSLQGKRQNYTTPEPHEPKAGQTCPRCASLRCVHFFPRSDSISCFPGEMLTTENHAQKSKTRCVLSLNWLNTTSTSSSASSAASVSSYLSSSASSSASSASLHSIKAHSIRPTEPESNLQQPFYAVRRTQKYKSKYQTSVQKK